MPARLKLLSQRLLGGTWDFEVYLALVTLFRAKDQFSVRDVRALCGPELKGPAVSKHMGELVLFGLLEEIDGAGMYEKIDDPFWEGMETIVRGWDVQPPTPAI